MTERGFVVFINKIDNKIYIKKSNNLKHKIKDFLYRFKAATEGRSHAKIPKNIKNDLLIHKSNTFEEIHMFRFVSDKEIDELVFKSYIREVFYKNYSLYTSALNNALCYGISNEELNYIESFFENGDIKISKSVKLNDLNPRSLVFNEVTYNSIKEDIKEDQQKDNKEPINVDNKDQNKEYSRGNVNSFCLALIKLIDEFLDSYLFSFDDINKLMKMKDIIKNISEM